MIDSINFDQITGYQYVLVADNSALVIGPITAKEEELKVVYVKDENG